MLNNCQKKKERDMERIGDKLFNIVNNFYNNNNSIGDLKNNRKSFNGWLANHAASQWKAARLR